MVVALAYLRYRVITGGIAIHKFYSLVSSRSSPTVVNKWLLFGATIHPTCIGPWLNMNFSITFDQSKFNLQLLCLED